MRALHYDRAGKPIDREDWSRLLGDRAYKVVKQEEVNGRQVSTVWLGLDHSFSDGPPLIFETMVFPEEDMDRYTTLQEAEAGHAAWVEKVKTWGPVGEAVSR